MTLIPELRAELHQVASEAPYRRKWVQAGWARISADRGSRRRRTGILSGASVAVAVAVVVVLLTAGTAAAPAFAVTRNANGSYTIVLRQLSTGIPALNAKFRQLGIPETVIPITRGCHSPDGSGLIVMHPNPLYEFNGAVTQTYSAAYQRRHPAQPGWHYVLAAKQLPNGKLLALIGQLKDPVPTCLPYSNTPSNVQP
jgi:hypothetical protein